MKKTIFVIVRYSILMKSRAWNISRDNDYLDYKQKLFDENRLKQHFFFFKNVMLPSIECQVEAGARHDLEVRLLVVTSSELPERAHRELANVLDDKSWADIVFSAPEESFIKPVNKYIKQCVQGRDVVYATVRLDDDDALHGQFVNGLAKYLTPGFVGHIVSFPKGYAVLYDQGKNKVVSALDIYYPKNAQGMALVSGYDDRSGDFGDGPINIFQTGKHTTVQERYPLILDESLSAYVRMCYKSQDTAEQFFKKRKKISKEVPPAEAFSGFNVKIAIDG